MKSRAWETSISSIEATHRVIGPFGGRPLAQSVCQSCGECVEHCPTGALVPKDAIAPVDEVETTCPYCGVGCSILLGVRAGRIVRARGNDKSTVNHGELCVKGRYGLDFVNHRDRLSPSPDPEGRCPRRTAFGRHLPGIP